MIDSLGSPWEDTHEAISHSSHRAPKTILGNKKTLMISYINGTLTPSLSRSELSAVMDSTLPATDRELSAVMGSPQNNFFYIMGWINSPRITRVQTTEIQPLPDTDRELSAVISSTPPSHTPRHFFAFEKNFFRISKQNFCYCFTNHWPESEL